MKFYYILMIPHLILGMELQNNHPESNKRKYKPHANEHKEPIARIENGPFIFTDNEYDQGLDFTYEVFNKKYLKFQQKKFNRHMNIINRKTRYLNRSKKNKQETATHSDTHMRELYAVACYAITLNEKYLKYLEESSSASL